MSAQAVIMSVSEASRICTGEIPFILFFGCPQDRQGMPHCVRNDKIGLFLGSKEAPPRVLAVLRSQTALARSDKTSVISSAWRRVIRFGA